MIQQIEVSTASGIRASLNGSRRHSRWLRSITIAPGTSPPARRWYSGRMSTGYVPAVLIPAAASAGSSRTRSAQAPARVSSMLMLPPSARSAVEDAVAFAPDFAGDRLLPVGVRRVREPIVALDVEPDRRGASDHGSAEVIRVVVDPLALAAAEPRHRHGQGTDRHRRLVLQRTDRVVEVRQVHV